LKKNNSKRKSKGSPKRKPRRKSLPTPTKRTAIPKPEPDEVHGFFTAMFIIAALLIRGEPFIFIVFAIIAVFWVAGR